MRRLLLLAATVLLASPAAVISAADRTPLLRTVDRSPLVLRGVGFEPLERVTLTATKVDGVRIVRRATATRAGTFVARFGVPYGSCAGIGGVRAVGAKGSVATIRAAIVVRDCPPPPSP